MKHILTTDNPRFGAVLLAVLLVWGCTDLCAQTRRVGSRRMPVVTEARMCSTVYRNYMDSLRNLKQHFSTWRYEGADTLSNPVYFPLLLPPTFYAEVSQRTMALPAGKGNGGAAADELPLWQRRMAAIDEVLMDLYTRHPEWVLYQATDTERNVGGWVPGETAENVRPQVKLTERVHGADEGSRATLPDAVDGDWTVEVKRPNFWNITTATSLQFTQYYVTDNWYKGGESNNSLLATMNVDANYDNKRKFIFTNKLEMRLGFQTSKGDDKHKLLTNSDLLRLTNTLGLQAMKNWYYTLKLQSWTQFYPGYRKNDDRVYSDFMSPFESILSLGMTYKLSKPKFTIDASIAPLSADFKYVDRKALATSFGLKEGKHCRWAFGSNVTVNYRWTIAKNISWSGRIYYFTDYKRVTAEWENTFNLQINKFLSTKLFLYPRFDDGVNRQEGDSYFQFNELLSLGFNYTF